MKQLGFRGAYQESESAAAPEGEGSFQQRIEKETSTAWFTFWGVVGHFFLKDLRAEEHFISDPRRYIM